MSANYTHGTQADEEDVELTSLVSASTRAYHESIAIESNFTSRKSSWYHCPTWVSLTSTSTRHPKSSLGVLRLVMVLVVLVAVAVTVTAVVLTWSDDTPANNVVNSKCAYHVLDPAKNAFDVSSIQLCTTRALVPGANTQHTGCYTSAIPGQYRDTSAFQIASYAVGVPDGFDFEQVDAPSPVFLADGSLFVIDSVAKLHILRFQKGNPTATVVFETNQTSIIPPPFDAYPAVRLWYSTVVVPIDAFEAPNVKYEVVWWSLYVNTIGDNGCLVWALIIKYDSTTAHPTYTIPSWAPFVFSGMEHGMCALAINPISTYTSCTALGMSLVITSAEYPFGLAYIHVALRCDGDTCRLADIDIHAALLPPPFENMTDVHMAPFGDVAIPMLPQLSTLDTWAMYLLLDSGGLALYQAVSTSSQHPLNFTVWTDSQFELLHARTTEAVVDVAMGQMYWLVQMDMDIVLTCSNTRNLSEPCPNWNSVTLLTNGYALSHNCLALGPLPGSLHPAENAFVEPGTVLYAKLVVQNLTKPGGANVWLFAINTTNAAVLGSTMWSAPSSATQVSSCITIVRDGIAAGQHALIAMTDVGVLLLYDATNLSQGQLWNRSLLSPQQMASKSFSGYNQYLGISAAGLTAYFWCDGASDCEGADPNMRYSLNVYTLLL